MIPADAVFALCVDGAGTRLRVRTGASVAECSGPRPSTANDRWAAPVRRLADLAAGPVTGWIVTEMGDLDGLDASAAALCDAAASAGLRGVAVLADEAVTLGRGRLADGGAWAMSIGTRIQWAAGPAAGLLGDDAGCGAAALARRTLSGSATNAPDDPHDRACALLHRAAGGDPAAGAAVEEALGETIRLVSDAFRDLPRASAGPATAIAVGGWLVRARPSLGEALVRGLAAELPTTRPYLAGDVLDTAAGLADWLLWERDAWTAVGAAGRLPLRTLELGATAPRTNTPSPSAPSTGADDDPVRECARLFGEMLGCAPPLPDTNFYLAGGDSPLMLRMLVTVRNRWSVTVAPADFMKHPTPLGLAGLIGAGQETDTV